MSLFIQFLIRFSPETNHFVPVSILFILLEYSLHIYHFSRFFSNLVFQVSLYTCRLEIRKIFRLSQYLTKFDRVEFNSGVRFVIRDLENFLLFPESF